MFLSSLVILGAVQAVLAKTQLFVSYMVIIIFKSANFSTGHKYCRIRIWVSNNCTFLWCLQSGVND